MESCCLYTVLICEKHLVIFVFGDLSDNHNCYTSLLDHLSSYYYYCYCFADRKLTPLAVVVVVVRSYTAHSQPSRSSDWGSYRPDFELSRRTPPVGPRPRGGGRGAAVPRNCSCLSTMVVAPAVRWSSCSRLATGRCFARVCFLEPARVPSRAVCT